VCEPNYLPWPISDHYSISLNSSIAHLSNVFGEVITLETVPAIYMQEQFAALFLNVKQADPTCHF
jgi:hypothetical protein